MSAWQDDMLAARVSLAEGYPVVEAGRSGTTGWRGFCYTSAMPGHGLCVWWQRAADGSQTFPMGTAVTGGTVVDLDSRAGFLLGLDELARRCGLDPAAGCWFRRETGGMAQSRAKGTYGGWRFHPRLAAWVLTAARIGQGPSERAFGVAEWVGPERWPARQEPTAAEIEAAWRFGWASDVVEAPFALARALRETAPVDEEVSRG